MGKHTTIQVPLKIDLDGRTLAQVLSERLANLHEFPSTGASSDGLPSNDAARVALYAAAK
jgi:hypothetical protein